MARKLLPGEFFDEIGKKCNIEPERAKKLWNEIVDFIVSELLMYGTVSLPTLGELQSRTRGGKIMHVPISTKIEDRGKTKEVYKEPYQIVQFLSSPKFRELINGRGATPAQTMRMREIYRRIKIEEEEQKKQFEYMEKSSNAFAIAIEKHNKNVKRQKEWKKLSQKKKMEIINKELKENSYWNDFDENEDEKDLN